MKTKLWIALAFFTTFALGFASGYWLPKAESLPTDNLTPVEQTIPDPVEEPPVEGEHQATSPPPPKSPQAPAATQPPPERPLTKKQEQQEKDQRERLAQLLQLRAEQKPAFDSSTKAFHQQMNRTLRETHLQTRRKLLSQNDSLDRRMREILDRDQYHQWKKYHLRRQRFLQQRELFMDQKTPRQRL